MTGETASPDRVPAPTSPTGHFEMRFSSTPRGARLARRLAGQRLDAWGIPYDSDTHHTLTLIVAELAANAIRHGRVSGRDFHLSLSCDAKTVRIEVTDTRTEGVPVVATPTDLRDTGRGLLLVEHLADRWDWCPRRGGPGKTVWAEYVLPAPGRPAAAPSCPSSTATAVPG
ncbi:ATP-binding protein [Streptomyces sp. Li-HN-5-11]|uniref:ATP-binding protein n=1 Tax=Streptomyces sp. Li-HN-5-11 TaxID=3075432 RepID=UPI0028AE1CBB|nr:ATP-binding protein [Streptomyces sp. Li-HN-5-11]WNM35812.1 ATP-binding protein [Streptomyces sp. Li-HN-5-11]